MVEGVGLFLLFRFGLIQFFFPHIFQPTILCAPVSQMLQENTRLLTRGIGSCYHRCVKE